jgi:hypothetical protein
MQYKKYTRGGLIKWKPKAERKVSNMSSRWLKSFVERFFANQFKRTCLPEGPKVGSVSLSPRGDWRMPSDAEAKLWLEDLEAMYLKLSEATDTKPDNIRRSESKS